MLFICVSACQSCLARLRCGVSTEEGRCPQGIFAILTPTIHITSSAILDTGAANKFSVFVLYHMAVDIIVSGIFSTSTFHRFCS